MKPRINVYLEDHVAKQLALLCKRPGANKSRIVSDALDQFLNPEQGAETFEALIRRLDRMSRSQERMDRNLSVTLETLALFIRYFLTITPPLSGGDQAHAHALGRERFEQFVAQVGRRLARDQNLLSEVLETLADTRPDLFMINPDGKPEGTNGATPNPKPAVAQNTFADTDDDLPTLRPVVFEDGDEDLALDPFDDDDTFEEDGFDDMAFEDDEDLTEARHGR
ncbi:MAG TPA: hypothetical protein PLI17_07955 [Denitromonas sp.]|uniref:hypothetical protein n=1 Tax=Salaquimonas pukyongi TaxID=2712698 RepID=UPI00096BCC12|nr:hypothetical protein [Salaquimonas pukyongi]HPR06549.1 hypothetical protein [Denitromonas sp.]HRX74602.1 hypothetical protein [Hyphomonas sp.]